MKYLVFSHAVGFRVFVTYLHWEVYFLFILASLLLIASKALSQSVNKPLSKTKSCKTSRTSKSKRRSTDC